MAIDVSARSPRADFFVPVERGVTIFVREVRGSRGDAVPVVLVHGARVPGLASFDLGIPGGSLAEDLAEVSVRAAVVPDGLIRGVAGLDAVRSPAGSCSPGGWRQPAAAAVVSGTRSRGCWPTAGKTGREIR
jgi:hypothetical protein